MNKTPLFHVVMGAAFDSLRPELKSVHDARRSKRLRGRCTVDRGQGVLARIISAMTSLPPSQIDLPVDVEIVTDGPYEIWNRSFDGHRMCSKLWAEGEKLCERLGPVKLEFQLIATGERIEWRLIRATAFRIPLPHRWFRTTGATESVVGGKYTFAVHATMPIIGALIRYEGWLQEYD